MITETVKKLFVLSVSIILVCVLAEPSWARKKVLTEAEQKAKVLMEAKVELNNTVWEIELKSMVTGKKKSTKSEKDKLRFVNNQIISDKLEAEGFSSSNYTIRIKGKNNDIVIWETMQASEKQGVAFWRGEIRKGRMRGVLSWHISERKKETYNFVSIANEVIPDEIELPESVVEEAEKPEEKPAK